MLKLNAKGISHLLIPLIVVVIGVAAFGTYKLVSSSAATRSIGYPLSGKAIVRNGNTQLVWQVRCSSAASCVAVSRSHAVFAGQKEKTPGCSRGICPFSVTVRGNQSGRVFLTKLYRTNDAKKPIFAQNVRYR